MSDQFADLWGSGAPGGAGSKSPCHQSGRDADIERAVAEARQISAALCQNLIGAAVNADGPGMRYPVKPRDVAAAAS